MKIETKYSVGDKIIVLADKKIKIKCPFCNGKNYKIVEGIKLYCQNCDDGKLVSRSDKKEETEAVIVGLRYEQKNLEDANIIDDEDKEYFTKVTDKEAILVEYFVDVLNDNYYGNGTYEESEILKKV